ncbi:hypothetical protein [Kytococcus sp. Marseille-QA3725]
MPSYRLVAEVLAVRGDTAPSQVLDIAREVVGRTHLVEKASLDLPLGVPQVTVRCVVEESNDDAEDHEAFDLAQRYLREMSEHVDMPRIEMRRRIKGRFVPINRPRARDGQPPTSPAG